MSEAMRVIVDSDNIRVISAGTQGPPGPPSLSPDGIITTEGDLIIGGTSGTPTTLAKGSTYDTLGLKQSTGRPWYRRTASINWLDHGVVASDSIDQTAQAQLLVDALALLGGGVIEVPDGTYRIENLLLKSGVYLMAKNPNHAYRAGSVGAVILKSTLSTGWVVDTPATGVATCGVIGIAMQGAGSTSGGGGVRFRDVSWGALKNVDLFNFGDQGFQQVAGLACVIEDVLAVGCLLDTTRAAVAGVIEIGGTDHYVSRVESAASLSAKTSASLYVNAVVVGGTNNMFANCVGEFADRGWYVSGNANKFTNCRGDHNMAHDWHITGGQNRFTNCTAEEGGQDATNTYDAFFIEGGANGFLNCFAVQNAAHTYKYLYHDTINNGSVLARNSYTNCEGYGYATARWYTEGYAGSSPSIPNHPIRPASGTTIDITGTQLVYLRDYSSPTTVTDFVNGVNGQSLYLVGDSDITIQNNGSIVTSTGANKNLVNDLMYHFILYNGVWREMA